MRHFSRRLAFATALVVAIPAVGSAKTVSASSPALTAHAAAPENFVPLGWHLWQIRRGDLNKDGISDAVLIMEHGKRGDSDDTYRLAAVFGNSAGGFDLVAENNELLNGVLNGDFAPYPNSEGFKIRHGAFTVQMTKDGPGGVATITFTFRHQDGRFVLIGYDYLGNHRGWIKLSFNMFTGQLVQTEGYVGVGNEVVVEKKNEGKFAPPKTIALDHLGNGFDFNDSFDPFKYALRRPGQ